MVGGASSAPIQRSCCGRTLCAPTSTTLDPAKSPECGRRLSAPIFRKAAHHRAADTPWQKIQTPKSHIRNRCRLGFRNQIFEFLSQIVLVVRSAGIGALRRLPHSGHVKRGTWNLKRAGRRPVAGASPTLRRAAHRAAATTDSSWAHDRSPLLCC